MRRALTTLLVVFTLCVALMGARRPAAQRHFLYVSEPGIRNYVEYGGVGVLVYDIDAGYKLVRRFPSQAVPAGQEPENVKGIAASAATGRLYVTTVTLPMEGKSTRAASLLRAYPRVALLGARVGDDIVWRSAGRLRRARIEQILFQPESSARRASSKPQRSLPASTSSGRQDWMTVRPDRRSC